MALPARLRQKRNRTERWRSPAHTKFVGEHACSVTGCTGRPIEVAHLRNGTDAAMGRKASDWFTLSLCQDHHSEQHRIGEVSFAERHGIDMHALAAEFAAASPKAADIRLEQRKRALDYHG